MQGASLKHLRPAEALQQWMHQPRAMTKDPGQQLQDVCAAHLALHSTPQPCHASKLHSGKMKGIGAMCRLVR